ncbi:hypothetical protein J3456_14085 [Sulfitobacter sp. NFXS29]
MTGEIIAQFLFNLTLAAPIGLGAYFVAQRKGRRPALYGAGTFFLALIMPILGGAALIWDIIRPATKKVS